MIDVSDWPDMNELMLVSDVLVTDYSSAIFEFEFRGRPMAFFVPDHAAYERERGLYVDFDAFAPGPFFETTDALADWLRAGAFDLDTVRSFAGEAFDVADRTRVGVDPDDPLTHSGSARNSPATRAPMSDTSG